MKTRKTVSVVLSLLAVLTAIIYFLVSEYIIFNAQAAYSNNQLSYLNSIYKKTDASVPAFTVSKTNSKNNISNLSFISAGDILFHMPEVMSAKENDTYNFKPMFSEVKDIISSKDIAVANFETTINPKKAPSGYPSFNTPVQALDALKDAGFQVLLNDHNHTLDTGMDGLKSTNNLMKQYGFKVLGSGDANEDKSVIVEKNNIKVGLLSYTYGTNYGIQYKDMINYIDESKIKDEIKKIKTKCDFTIVYLHLGTEYVRSVEPFQAALVRKVADFGADAILCSHPHVARKSEMLYVDGRQVLVDYSMGNFISNQNDKYTDIGSMVSISLEKNNSAAFIKAAEIIPVYRLRYTDKGKTIYKAVPFSKVNKFTNILTQNTLSYINEVSKEISFKYPEPYYLYVKNKTEINIYE